MDREGESDGEIVKVVPRDAEEVVKINSTGIGAALLGLVLVATGAWVGNDHFLNIPNEPKSDGTLPAEDPISGGALEENENLEELIDEPDQDQADTYSWTLDDTAVMFNITNNSNETRHLTIYSAVVGKLPTDFMVWGKLYRETQSATNLYQFGYMGDRGFFGIRHEGFSLEAPIGYVTVLGRAEEWSQRDDVELAPGMNQLVVSAQNVELAVDILFRAPVDGKVEINVAHEDPDMVQHRFSHIEGHWDQVNTELWSFHGGYADAFTNLMADYSYRMVQVSTPLSHTDLTVRDSAGNECSANTAPSDLHGAMVRMKPTMGEISVSGSVLSTGGPPWFLLIFYNFPVDVVEDTWPDCYVFGEGSALEKTM